MALFDRKKAYAPLTDKEKKEKIEREKRAREVIDDAQGAAKLCLESSLFKDYFQKLLMARDAIVDLILAIDEPTPETEWKKFKELQIELRQLEYLLREMEKDLNKIEVNKKS